MGPLKERALNVDSMIVGHGIDIVETHRLRELLDRHGDRFLNRVFTEAEQNYCRRNPKRFVEHLAGRFAAKEAVLKALGTGWSNGISWTDIEISPSPAGQPKLKLSGVGAEIASRLGISDWQLSISHISTHATASAIAMKESED
ncbi:MAG TPA: holo-ACP synthase [Tepidisphaeraceae bacterium]|nr:holo-ACP synthase [Tepidisphaeraceae bacterium]